MFLRLLLVSFLESFATICLERGIYFYTESRLQFAAVENLWLSLAFGAAYVIGALMSHGQAGRLGLRRLLTGTLLAQIVLHLVLYQSAGPARIFTCMTALGWVNGLKWPLIESYISAGRTPRQTFRAVGWFNLSWAVAVAPALAVVGQILHSSHPELIFLLPAIVNVLDVALVLPLPASPEHLPADHPERPAALELRRLRGLLSFSRWTMLAGYAALWVLAALMPIIFRNMGYDVKAGATLSGLVDVARLAAFAVFGFYRGWHGRLSPLCVAMLVLPVGFCMVMSGHDVATVLTGEVLFGLAAGLVYYASLYYAMVVQNAAVEAGGAHEGLIGLGFALGPLAVLTGLGTKGLWGGEPTTGVYAGMGLIFVICAGGAWTALGKTWRRRE